MDNVSVYATPRSLIHARSKSSRSRYFIIENHYLPLCCRFTDSTLTGFFGDEVLEFKSPSFPKSISPSLLVSPSPPSSTYKYKFLFYVRLKTVSFNKQTFPRLSTSLYSQSDRNRAMLFESVEQGHQIILKLITKGSRTTNSSIFSVMTSHNLQHKSWCNGITTTDCTTAGIFKSTHGLTTSFKSCFME